MPIRRSSNESALTKQQIITQLTRSSHGDLKQYVEIGKRAASEDPEFFSHLIAWNEVKGTIRDSKVALPVVYLSTGNKDQVLVENALAHMALRSPRELLKTVRFSRDQHARTTAVRSLVGRYLRAREEKFPWWERNALQFRSAMKELYALCHIKPSAMADLILFKKQYPVGTIFDVIAKLKDMSPEETAGNIINKRIPFLTAIGALGKKAEDEALALALIKQMSPTELTTNSKMLEKLGVRTKPVLRAAYEEALEKAAKSKKGQTFKTGKAIEAVDDDVLKAKLEKLQEKQIEKLGSVEGNWLVLGDKSGSMQNSIETSRMVAATLAKMVSGDVYLIFFDTTPALPINVKGKTYEEIKKLTSRVMAGGGTSIGCGLKSIMDRNVVVDGIAVVTDGENTTYPTLPQVYESYVQLIGKSIPIYMYKVAGGLDNLSTDARNLPLTVFDIRHNVDYYALPNLIQTMRTNVYSLTDEIMETPLLTLDKVFNA